MSVLLARLLSLFARRQPCPVRHDSRAVAVCGHCARDRRTTR